MDIRPYRAEDLSKLIDLTIDTFGPCYEDTVRPLVGDLIFRHQHGTWRTDYHELVRTLHDPSRGKHVAVMQVDPTTIGGYIGWSVDLNQRHGEIIMVAVAAAHRGQKMATALCEHAFTAMEGDGIEVVQIGTGGDPFHAPARGLYRSLDCRGIPAVVYFKAL